MGCQLVLWSVLVRSRVLDDFVFRDFRRDEPGRPGDLEAVLALRARVFPAQDLARERRRWRWEFDRNPFRSAAVPDAWVFEQASSIVGPIVGNYGLVPTPVAIDGKIELCFNGIDFAVAPELQGKGLGHRIIERHMDPALCRFPFLTGPTPAVSHLVASHGGSVIRCREEPSVFAFACGAPTPTPLAPREIALRPIAGFEPRFDDLWRRVAESFRILVARDHRYLNWRYRDFPFAKLTMISALDRSGYLRGLLILQHEKEKNAGYLLELFADPRDEPAYRALITAAIEAGRRAKMNELYVLHRSPAVQALLLANGFWKVEGHALELACRLPTPKPGEKPFTAADLYWSAGDGDLLYVLGDLEESGST